jgi:tetratricopeptide (TPR) repeat protein
LAYHRVTVVATAMRPETSAGSGLASKRNVWLNSSRLPAIFEFTCRAVCFVALVLLVPSAAVAQRSHGGPTDQAPGSVTQEPMALPDVTPDPFTLMNTPGPSGLMAVDTGRMIDSESCSSWTESGVHSPTVSAMRLAVPGNASGEYQKACGAFKNKKFPDAEQHLRKAINFYSNYAAAWVVLGQVLESENKNDDAKAACSTAEDLDPG